MKPARKRQIVGYLRDGFRISERRDAAVVGSVVGRISQDRASHAVPAPSAAAAPGEQHAHLAALVGEWNARMSM